MRARVIPILLIEDYGLVKTINFKKRRYIGDPINTIRLFNEMEVDELVILDISNTKSNSEIDFEYIEEIVSNAFMPITYGGGIKNINHIERLILSGVEKVSINSTLLKDKSIITEASRKFGSQSLVAAIDVKRTLLGNYRIYNYLTQKFETIDLVEFIKQLELSGIGELLITDVSKEGSMSGYDLRLLDLIKPHVNVPMIYNGGASELSDIRSLISGGADAAAAGSLFVYKSRTRGILINYPTQKQLIDLLR